MVDNGSEDGSADFVRQHYPGVRLVALDRNLGFGGGSNAGFHAAQNDVVVLLNSDMRVDPGFLAPLLDGFTDEKVFAVSCQIFMSDAKKLRAGNGPYGRLVAAGRACESAIASTPRSPSSSHAFTEAEAPAPLTATSFSSWAASIISTSRSIWKTPTWATWRGSAAGRCFINPPALSITSIAAPSASASAMPTFRACSRRTSCCSRGKIFTTGNCWPRISFSPGPTRCFPGSLAIRRSARVSRASPRATLQLPSAFVARCERAPLPPSPIARHSAGPWAAIFATPLLFWNRSPKS